MVSNTVPVRTLHGRSQGVRHCRRCSETFETLPHVLGNCPYGGLLRNDRHHRVRSMLASALRNNGLEVYEELPTLDRRLDILAIDRGNKTAVVLDPTIRTETGCAQFEEVDTEKRMIYEPCADDLRMKCNMEGFTIKVYGILIGSKGTITTQVQSILKEMKIPNSVINDIIISVVKGSVTIVHNHLYSPT